MKFLNRALSLILLSLILLTGLCLFGCGQEPEEKEYNLVVFVPGVLEGSPTYAMMDEGVRRAAAEDADAITVKTVQGGFNQADWPRKMKALAAEGRYDLIITSNPAMPEICLDIARDFPEQQFLCLEGSVEENDQVTALLFNHRELAYLLGYQAGLITASSLPHVRKGYKAGLLAGQEYPVMNQAILPGYIEGLEAAAPGGSVDFRILGNWYDAAKAGDMVREMIRQGADVILPIAGGGNQGAVAAAREEKAYLQWYDTTGYQEAPGIVLGSGLLRQDKGAYEMVKGLLSGTVERGTTTRVGIREGYIGFDTEDSLYQENLPREIRKKMEDLLNRFASGEIKLPMPQQF